MDRKLIEAWEMIEANARLDEKRKLGKVTAVKSTPKAKTTAIKKLKEDGNPAPTAGGTFTSSENAAQFKKRIGEKRVCQEEVIGDLVSGAAASGDPTAKRVQDKAVNTASNMVREEDLEAPADPHAEGPEAAAAMDQGAEEGAEDVSVDAETAEQVVQAIQAQYPGAVITISVQLPEDTPFDTDIVAAAQEVAGDEAGMEAGLGGDEAGLDAGAEVAPEAGAEPAADEEKPMLEKRKLAISKTRKQIKEMFKKFEKKEDKKDEAKEEVKEQEELAPEAGAEVAPEAGLDAGAEVAPEAGLGDGTEVAAGPEPEVEVGDTKIALSPEQWGQVLATTDLLNGEAGAELAPEAGAGEEPPADLGADAEAAIDELKVVHDLSDPNSKGIVKKLVVGPEDKADEKKAAVGIKPANKQLPKIQESFGKELAEYAKSLKKMMTE
jgi:hypothetical protein